MDQKHQQNQQEGHDESRRDFLKRLMSAALVMGAGLFAGSKESMAHAAAVASGKCSSSYSCSGGTGKCGSSFL